MSQKLTAGDAVASDTIYSAVCFARAHKPVVASFSDVAASGGYYAAAGADVIYSNSSTITGSIGVIVAYPIIKRLLKKIDISSDAIEFIPNAAWHHPELGNLPPAELKKLRRHVDTTYETFKLVVSEGRRMSIDDVEKVAQGQVFTGSQAMVLGLVDRIGGLNDTLLGAAVLSIEKERRDDYGALRYLEKVIHDILEGRGLALELIKAGILEDHLFMGEREPTDDEIHALLERASIMIRPAVSVTTIPHVNPANEVLGYVISSAFASEEERSPVPIDQPIPEPTDEGGDGAGGPEKSRVVMGALLGLARTNNIPIWQFPFFCYWAAQAVGKVGDGVVGGIGSGILDRMFAGIFGGGVVREGSDVPGAIGRHIKSIDGGRPPLFNDAKSTGMDIRLEMMPLQIYF
jgi:signal peptide peptidase SppA